MSNSAEHSNDLQNFFEREIFPAKITTPNKTNTFNNLQLLLCPTESHQGISLPVKAEVNVNYNGQTLKVDWTTDRKTFGSSEIAKSRAAAPSEYTPLPDVADWELFKKFINNLDHRHFIFRGQSLTKRLRTSFHSG